jgi:hypothetical protein
MFHEDDEPDVNVAGGYHCDACEYFVFDWEVDDDDDPS